MYLHLGQDVVIKTKDIVAIFDIEKASLSKFTRQFLAKSTKDKKVITVSYEMPKSVIVCTDFVYVSQISTATLYKRFNQTLK